MASTSKYVKYNSAMDDIISIIRRSYFGKPVDEDFLCDLKSLMETKMIAVGVMKSPEESILNTELESLPLPNEILVKIFGYLDIQDISSSARVSHQFNMISKNSSLWKSWGKLYFEEKKVPTEFLAYVTQRGISELSLLGCEILPPRVKLTQPLNLRALKLEATWGDLTLVNEILTTQFMEEIDFTDTMMSDENNISQFIKRLPQIGSRLKNLNLEGGGLGKNGDLGTIALIVNSCLGLEELNLSWNTLKDDAVDYLCENLTPNILKLNLEIGETYAEPDKGLNDDNIRALVKRCPKLKVLDIRTNEEMTYHGLWEIIEKLLFLEILALPDSIGAELGLPDNINLNRVHSLKSMKKLKELVIGENCSDKYQSIYLREIPHLRKHKGRCDLEVAMTKTKNFKGVKFCPNCHHFDQKDYWGNHEC